MNIDRSEVCLRLFSVGHRRQLEQLQAQMEELEVRYKTEVHRLKSKFQTELDELRLRYESLKKIKAEMEIHLKKLQANLKDIQDRLIEEQALHEATREILSAAEKRNGRIAVSSADESIPSLGILRGEIEELRILLDRVSSCLFEEETSVVVVDVSRVRKLERQPNWNYTIRNNG